jgi:hypothetical protein
MKHKHHIKPRYEGGSDEPDNLVELTPIQHAMWHYAEWLRKGNRNDYLAWRGLSGYMGKEEIIRELQVENGKKVQEMWRVNDWKRNPEVMASHPNTLEYRESRSITVICLNTGKVYPSITAASRDTKIDKGNIRGACEKGWKTKGLSWSYA